MNMNPQQDEYEEEEDYNPSEEGKTQLLDWP